MTQLVPNLQPMTEKEALHALSQLRGSEERQKAILLEMHNRKAYEALGYENWEAFADKELGVSRQHFYKLLEVARVENVIREIPVDKKLQRAIGALPITWALELAKLPTPELQAEAWKEAHDIAPKLTYKGADSRYNGYVCLTTIKNVVARRLGTTEVQEKITQPQRQVGVKPTPPPPSTFDTQAQQNILPAVEIPTPVAVPVAVAIEEPFHDDTESELDFDSWGEALDTLYAWIQNKEVLDGPKTRKFVRDNLYQIIQWINECEA